MYAPLVGAGSSLSITSTRIVTIVSSSAMAALAVVIGNMDRLDITSWVALQNGIVLQVAPAFVMGLYSKSISATPLTLGMLIGVSATIIFHFIIPVLAPTFNNLFAAWIGILINACVVYAGVIMDDGEEEEEKPAKTEKNRDQDMGSISSIELSFSPMQRLSSVVDPPFRNPQKQFRQFSTPLPNSLIGFRISLDNENDIFVHDQFDHIEQSISEVSNFSDSFVIDHARYGSTTLGSIGRIGDRQTEPIHNLILIAVTVVMLLFTTPFYLNQGTEVLTAGVPTWVYLSMQASLMASLIMVYTMFSSWDMPKSSAKDKADVSKSHSMNLGSMGSVETASTGVEDSTMSVSIPAPAPLRKGAIQRQSSAAKQARVARPVPNQRYRPADQFSITDIDTMGSFSLSEELRSNHRM
jgi:hypothetical protein